MRKSEMKNENKQASKVKAFIKNHKKEIFIISAGVGAAGISFLGFKHVSKLNVENAKDAIKHVSKTVLIDKAGALVKETNDMIKEPKKIAPRYLVEFKAFKTGDWYTKTRTDYVRSAYSVGACNSYGRAYRIIDTLTGDVLKEVAEDASMAACNGYPNGYPW